MSLRARVARAALALDLAANTLLELSPGVGRWWKSSSESGEQHLPPVVRDIVGTRPDTGEADVHAVMWFVAGLLLLMVVRSAGRRGLALGALWAYGGLLELIQPLMTRAAQWSDLVANAIGIAVAVCVVRIVERRRERVGGHGARAGLATERRRGNAAAAVEEQDDERAAAVNSKRS